MSINSQFAHVLQVGTSGPKYLVHQHDRVETEDDGFGRITGVNQINDAVLSAYSPTNQPVIAKGASIDEVLQEIKHSSGGQEIRWIGMAEHDGDRYTIFHGA